MKIRHIITQVKDGKLVPRPEFQRRLVWKSEDRVRFIDTILRSYPFPEIYIANGSVDVDTGEGQQLLVDGQQRVTAIFDYFRGEQNTRGPKVPPYASLEREEKENFLNYDVAVRDLGSVSRSEIIEVFSRINSTNYSLTEIEINNAVYQGELMQVSAAFAEHEFFENHKIFRSNDIRRMGDVRFMLQIIITMIVGYFNRDECLQTYLEEYNENFPNRLEIARRLEICFSYIEECGFLPKSRIWKKTDLFTAIVEIDSSVASHQLPGPLEALERLDRFYDQVDAEGTESQIRYVSVYAKASLQASNDRINRIRRGAVFNAILLDADPEEALFRNGLA